ncbi:MAG: hypothetical protein P1U67_08140 [Alcanivoracaceae bacterium]|nr:hypothetical protein [Alcanivoracaceae bacterium]
MNKNFIITSICIVAALFSTFFWWAGEQSASRFSSFDTSGDRVSERHAESELTLEDLKTLDEDTVTAMQLHAAEMAGKNIDQPEYVGVVSERPDFISPVEWYVVNGVADRSPNPEKELTRLVNNFRFIKQMELWEALSGSTGSEKSKRNEIAEHLLNSLPARLSAQDMDKSQAQRIQLTLLSDLEPDPKIRQKRLAEEARRIGVKFEIQRH